MTPYFSLSCQRKNTCWWMLFNYPGPVSSPWLFSTSYETEKATKGQNKPCEGFNVRSQLGRSGGCQRAGRDNYPVAFTGLNRRKFLCGYYYSTKIIRTPWIPPRVLSCSAELCFLPLSACPSSHHAHLWGYHPDPALRHSERETCVWTMPSQSSNQ